jgi:hypothetical protein
MGPLTMMSEGWWTSWWLLGDHEYWWKHVKSREWDTTVWWRMHIKKILQQQTLSIMQPNYRTVLQRRPNYKDVQWLDKHNYIEGVDEDKLIDEGS